MVRRHYILRVITKLLLPFILLFALYVQFHGDFGPGGGFQAGVIFGAAFITYALIYGVDAARQVIPEWVTRWLMALVQRCGIQKAVVALANKNARVLRLF